MHPLLLTTHRRPLQCFVTYADYYRELTPLAVVLSTQLENVNRFNDEIFESYQKLTWYCEFCIRLQRLITNLKLWDEQTPIVNNRLIAVVQNPNQPITDAEQLIVL